MKTTPVDPQQHDQAGRPHFTLREHILLWLLKYPLQRLDDLALAMGVHPSTVYRHLMAVQREGLVEQVKVSQFQPVSVVYHLTTAGIRLVASWLQAEPVPLARMWHADEQSLLQLLPRIIPLIQLQNVINALVRQAPTFLAAPHEQQVSLRWHWVRDYAYRFSSKGKERRVSLDGVLVFSKQQPDSDALVYTCLFVLFDPGYIGDRDLHLMRERIANVLHFRESAERWTYYSLFPSLLIIAPSQRQRELWQWCADETAHRLALAPLRGAVAVLPAHQGMVSSHHLQWHALTHGSCHLQDLVFPLPREALPPGILSPQYRSCVQQGRSKERKIPVIVRGRFVSRARQREPDLAEKRSTGLSLAFVSLNLGHRHMNLLFLLYAYPLLSVNELAVFSELAVTSLKRYLYDLKRLDCLEMHETEHGQRLSLSQNGLRLMAVCLRVPLSHLAQKGQKDASDYQFMQWGTSHLLHTLAHTTGVYWFLSQLHQCARQQGHTVLWYETGARCGRRYYHQGAWHNLLPDAAFAYMAGGRTIRAWLEWDEGTMNRRDLEAKMRAYTHFVRSGQWRKESRALSVLLIVTPDLAQELMMRSVAMEVLGETTVVVFCTTRSYMQEYGPLEKIWISPFCQNHQRRTLFD